jgi:hypothetical protein
LLFEVRSLASLVSCPFILRPRECSAITRRIVPNSWLDGPLLSFSYPDEEHGWNPAEFGVRSTPSLNELDCGHRGRAMVHAFMIFARMPAPGLCRLYITSRLWRGSGCVLTRHNQRPSRKANSLSSGRYRVGLTPSGSVRESAFSFNCMSAWRYTFVVSVDSCPSHSAITEQSTPW